MNLEWPGPFTCYLKFVNLNEQMNDFRMAGMFYVLLKIREFK